MDIEQFYKDVMEYNINPSVFEFDAQPQNGPISMIPSQPYEDNSTSGYLMQRLGFQRPYKSQEELQQEEEQRIEQEKIQQEKVRQQWCNEFKNNHVVVNLQNVFGKLDKQQLKSIKSILDSDNDTTYIYARFKR